MTDTDTGDTGAAEAAAPTDAEAATAEISGLARDQNYQASWSGKNGRQEQLAAAAYKSGLMRRAHGGPADEPEPNNPQAIADGLLDSSEATQSLAAGMTPAADVSEYKFKFEGTADMDTAALADLTSVAAKGAMAAGASVEYARATIEHVDQVLSKSSGEMANAGDIEDALQRQFGPAIEATQEHARATLAKMPEKSQAMITNALDRMPAADGAWLMGRLATLNKVHR
jgi:hypothetical protein